MIRWIGETISFRTGREQNHFVFGVEQRPGGHHPICISPGECSGDRLAMPHSREQFISLPRVIVNAPAIFPAVRGEIQRGHIILLAIRRHELAQPRAVRPRLPREESEGRMICFRDIQICFRPIPKRVELRFFVQLDGDDHPVGQTFRSHIVVFDVGDVCQRTVGIASGGIVNGLVRRTAMKQLLERAINFLRISLFEWPFSAKRFR